jgi:hypothetical protein
MFCYQGSIYINVAAISHGADEFPRHLWRGVSANAQLAIIRRDFSNNGCTIRS